ncbi:MAG: DUF5050 domain-containing protein [Ruminococcus sp.]|nr:DUF5050 domain-containing protein [Ruminococcus sp.]
MKRLMSAVLTFAMLITMFVVPVTGTSAKTTKKAPTTYIATNRSYAVKNGSVFSFDKGTLQYRTKQGKTKTLAKFSDFYSCKYYVRSNTVYYNTNNQKSHCLMQVGLNGKNKKKLYSSKTLIVSLIGGYGSSVIFQCGEKICRYKDGKVKTLIKTDDGILFFAQIFNGKIYYNNKSYDLATGKTKTYKGEYSYSTKNYLYFVNSKMDLKRLDKSGKINTVATKITDLNYVDGDTVCFSKKNSNNKEAFYKRTGVKNKAIQLCTWNDIYGKFKDKEGLKLNSIHFVTVEIAEGKVYLSPAIMGGMEYDEKTGTFSDLITRQALLTVPAKGGTPKMIYECKGYDGIKVMTINNKLQYKVMKNLYSLQNAIPTMM